MVSTTLVKQGSLGSVKYRTYTITNLTGSGTTDTIQVGTWRQLFFVNPTNSSDDESLQITLTSPTATNPYFAIGVESVTAGDNGKITIGGK